MNGRKAGDDQGVLVSWQLVAASGAGLMVRWLHTLEMLTIHRRLQCCIVVLRALASMTARLVVQWSESSTEG